MPFLYLVLVVAFCVRFYGIWANLPYVVHPDEPQIVNRALSLNPSDMNPHFFDWPGSLLIYVLFVCYRMLSLFGNLFRGIFGTPPGFIEDISTYYFIGRFVVVLFGVATIYLVYQIGLKIYDARVGLVAALFLTFSFLHVEASHHALPDIPLTFFMMLSFLALLAAKLFIDGVSCIFRKLNLATRPRQFLALSSAAVLVLLPGWSI
ncbi:MAG: ArnT family glycosyltransferase, partial [Candidatus Poribacteria bacterium]